MFNNVCFLPAVNNMYICLLKGYLFSLNMIHVLTGNLKKAQKYRSIRATVYRQYIRWVTMYNVFKAIFFATIKPSKGSVCVCVCGVGGGGNWGVRIRRNSHIFHFLNNLGGRGVRIRLNSHIFSFP